MNLEQLKKRFADKLSEIYTSSESTELFSIFTQEYLDLSKIEVRQNLNTELSESVLKLFLDALTHLENEIPYQYILGYSEFYGHQFLVSPAVLIPRPETEELLELTIREIKELQEKSKKPNGKHLAENVEDLKILDIGTGSGIIPIILKLKFPDAKISAIEFSPDALQIAEQNADKHEVKINYILADYLNTNFTEVYDVIISNPPYIGITEESEIDNTVKNTEPKLALFSPTNDSLVFYKKIAAHGHQYLAENGQIFLEINQKLGPETLALFNEFSYSKLLKDLSGNDRIIHVRK